MSHAAIVQLHHRESFEHNLARALAFGAAAGAFALLTRKLGEPLPPGAVILAATGMALARGDRLDRALLVVLSLVAAGAPLLFGLSNDWTLAFSGTCLGLIMVKAAVCEHGDEGLLASDRPGTANYVLGAIATAGLATAGFRVAQVFEARLEQLSTPALLIAAFCGAVLALFCALGSLAAHLALRPDPVEARCEELLPGLSGELKTLCSRCLALYRQCGRTLAMLPRENAREELAKTLAKTTQDAVELASDWAGVEAQLEQTNRTELSKELAQLGEYAKAAKDPLARRQLELAAESLQEELCRLSELELRKERVIAKLRAETALLERARVALISLLSGQVQLKSAELAALAQKLRAQADAQSKAGLWADAVATGAELTQQELEEQTATERRSSPPLPSAPSALP